MGLEMGSFKLPCSLLDCLILTHRTEKELVQILKMLWLTGICRSHYLSRITTSDWRDTSKLRTLFSFVIFIFDLIDCDIILRFVILTLIALRVIFLRKFAYVYRFAWGPRVLDNLHDFVLRPFLQLLF